jgi:hypothetical protein
VIFDKLAYVGLPSFNIYLTSPIASKTQASLFASVFQSSSTLGTGKASTFQEGRRHLCEEVSAGSTCC